jgi:hypothetical protein
MAAIAETKYFNDDELCPPPRPGPWPWPVLNTDLHRIDDVPITLVGATEFDQNLNAIA